MVPYSSTEQRRGVRKGAWTKEEDALLTRCINKYGEGKWKEVPLRADLNRCRKSCRLRWINYLRPDIKRGAFAADEADLIMRLHKLLGNRWSLIAGRIPGRTANDIKNYWNSHLKKLVAGLLDTNNGSCSKVIKPQPHVFKPNSQWLRSTFNAREQQKQPHELPAPTPSESDKDFLFEGGDEKRQFVVDNGEGMGSGADPFGFKDSEVEWDDFFRNNELCSLLEPPGENITFF